MKKPTFSIYMIVKNEEQMIEEALKSTEGVDELVVVDTGSIDKTVEIAKRYTKNVYEDYLWNDDFSEAKNHAASKCTSDWIMSLDADCRLEKGGVEKIMKIISRTNLDVINVILTPKGRPSESHKRGKIYRNNGSIYYLGKAHEDLNVLGKDDDEGIFPIITYDYSPNHYKDPDRYIRILTKAVKEEPQTPRWRFYLAREYYYRKDYKVAIDQFTEYIKDSNYPAEKAEALVMLAECYWYTNQGEIAREKCLRAIQINPDFKYALKLMSIMHFEPNKSKWLKIANQAENKDVMFKR
jgi:glycosyltransferase involved in cell wall biosynthesis